MDYDDPDLVRGCLWRDAGFANHAIAAVRRGKLDRLGLRWAACGAGDPGRHSRCSSCRFPAGCASNAALADSLVDRGHRAGMCLSGPMGQGHQRGFTDDGSWTLSHPNGWLYSVDLIVGLALVAFHEEVIFRRCAQQVFQPYFGDGYGSVVATSLLFGCYHWWAGVGVIIEASISGALFMLFLKRCGVLWPVVLAHFLSDVIIFDRVRWPIF
jgi:hypothetical protein